MVRSRWLKWALLPATWFVACSSQDRSATGAGGAVCAPCASAGEASADAGTGEAGRGAGEGGEGALGAGGTAPDAGSAGEAGAAALTESDAVIREVSLWQAMRVPLVANGNPVTSTIPVIANKPGILRVFVEPGPGFRRRELAAHLELTSGTQLTSSKLVFGASVPSDFTTTFNFPLQGSELSPGASFVVTLSDSAAQIARSPKFFEAALPLVSAGSLRVVLVPLVVSGVPPSLPAETVELFRARLAAMYPVPDVALSVHAPVVTDLSVGADTSTGWGDVLDRLYALRAAEMPDDNVFYYGLFTPAASFADYCTGSCTVGLSNVAAPDDVSNRGAVGLGVFADGSNADAPDTMAHELGHALGRYHAPCQTTDAAAFPYRGGKIGVWGFDATRHALLDPSDYGDVMGYCSPDWISDFTYRGLFERLALVNSSAAKPIARALPRARQAFRRIVVAESGALHWASALSLTHSPSGQAVAVALRSRAGAGLATTTGYFQPFSDGGGGFLLVSEAALAAFGATRLAWGGAELELARSR